MILKLISYLTRHLFILVKVKYQEIIFLLKNPMQLYIIISGKCLKTYVSFSIIFIFLSIISLYVIFNVFSISGVDVVLKNIDNSCFNNGVNIYKDRLEIGNIYNVGLIDNVIQDELNNSSIVDPGNIKKMRFIREKYSGLNRLQPIIINESCIEPLALKYSKTKGYVTLREGSLIDALKIIFNNNRKMSIFIIIYLFLIFCFVDDCVKYSNKYYNLNKEKIKESSIIEPKVVEGFWSDLLESLKLFFKETFTDPRKLARYLATIIIPTVILNLLI